MAKCLEDHGVAVPGTYAEMLAAQETNSLPTDECDGAGVYSPYAEATTP